MTALALCVLLAASPAAKMPSPPQVKAAKAFLAAFREADPGKTVLADAKIDPKAPDTLVITVGSEWTSLTKGQRLDGAMSFWKAWAVENHANQPEPNRCRIVLVSPAGRPLGGSGVLGGSSITVED